MKLRGSLRGDASAPISLFAFQDIIFAATGIFLFIAIMMTFFGKIDQFSTEELEEHKGVREKIDSLAERKTVAQRQLQILDSPEAFISTTPTETNPVPQPNNSELALHNPWLYDLEELFRGNEGLRKKTDEKYSQLTSAIMEMNRLELRLEGFQLGAFQKLREEDIAIVREGPAHDFREPIFISINSDTYTIAYPGRPELNEDFKTPDELERHIRSNYRPETQSFLLYLKPSGIKNFKETKDRLQSLGYSIGYEPVVEGFSL